MTKLRAPDGVVAVSVGPVHVAGPEADVGDPQVEAVLIDLGWTPAKPAASKK